MIFLFSFCRIKGTVFFHNSLRARHSQIRLQRGMFPPFWLPLCAPERYIRKRRKKEYGVSNFPLEEGGGRIFSSLFTPDFSLGKERVEGTKNIPSVGGSHDNFFIVRGFIAPMQARERRSRRKGKKVFLVGKERVRKVHRKRKKNGEEEGRRTVWGGTIIYFLSPNPSLHTAEKKERKSPPRTFKHLHHGARGAWC